MGEVLLKEKDTYCLSTYGTYETFIDADYACKNDIRCYAVLDYDCDNEGTLRLCSIPVTIELSDRGSCIYRKGT